MYVCLRKTRFSNTLHENSRKNVRGVSGNTVKTNKEEHLGRFHNDFRPRCSSYQDPSLMLRMTINYSHSMVALGFGERS